MRTAFTATAPAAYTSSFAATLTVAAMLGLAAGAKTAKVWDRQAMDTAMSTKSQRGIALSERDPQLQRG